MFIRAAEALTVGPETTERTLSHQRPIGSDPHLRQPVNATTLAPMMGVRRQIASLSVFTMCCV